MRSRGIHRRPPSRRVSATAAAAIRTASQAVYMDLMFLLLFLKIIMKIFLFKKNIFKKMISNLLTFKFWSQVVY